VSRERILRRRLHTLETLEEAVAALRALSAQHFRAVRELLPAARAYREEIEAALGAFVSDDSGASLETTAPTGIVLVAADLGLVGDYSTRLVREALDLRESHGAGPLLCLGHRARAPLQRAGIRPDRMDDAPTSLGRLPELLLPLVDRILELRRAGRLGSLWLVAARFEGAGRFRAMRVPVLPVVAARTSSGITPSPYCTPTHLEAVMIREYLYAVLYETMVEALASEHGKRLVTAESARSWLLDRIDTTHRRVASSRRESSTQEVLEVVAAARASGHAGGADR
jgi:F-type H+-transporting ATPase subunit gamma